MITPILVRKIAREFNLPSRAVYDYFMPGPGNDSVRAKLAADGYDTAGTWFGNKDWFKKHGVTKLDYDQMLFLSDFDLERDFDLENEHDVIKTALRFIKQDNPGYARAFIELVKDEGYEYPEFAAIEKSLNHDLKEAASELEDKYVSRFVHGSGLQHIYSMMKHAGLLPAEQKIIFDKILSNKENVIKKALTYLKHDDISALIQLMYYSKKYGYDYPEFKAIEKSQPSVKLAHEVALKARQHDPNLREEVEEPSEITKEIRKIAAANNLTVNFSIPNITKAYNSFRFSMRNRGGKTRAEAPVSERSRNFLKQIKEKFPNANIIGGSYGTIIEIPNDEEAYYRFKIFGKPVKKDTKVDKDTILKDILIDFKNGGSGSRAKLLMQIKALRHLGYDWPELKAIEKSINSKG